MICLEFSYDDIPGVDQYMYSYGMFTETEIGIKYFRPDLLYYSNYRNFSQA